MSNEKNKYWWETPDVDLDFRHYSGSPSDAIKTLKRNIENYLVKPEVTRKDREIYSAIYNALEYYKKILYLPGFDFYSENTFLNYSLRNMKKDFDYLSQKYNSQNPEDPPVISMNARIKAPISVLDKIKEKISEYLKNGTDLGYFNESLRDFIGIRVVVDPPKNIQESGLEAENLYLYKVFYDLMSYHGIEEADQTNLKPGNYKFIPINTRNNPHKSDDIKNNSNNDGGNVPQYIQKLDKFLKNYVQYPKESGYQSLHICATPDYSQNIVPLYLPPCIIPPKNIEYSFEYQLRTKKQDDKSNYDPKTAHFIYKLLEYYQRLAIPFYIEYDPQENLFKTLNLNESCKKHYGYSIEELILTVNSSKHTNSHATLTFNEFRDLFTTEERNAILALQKTICYDPNLRGYYLEDMPTALTVSKQVAKKPEINEYELQNMINDTPIADSIISLDQNDRIKITKPKLKIYHIEKGPKIKTRPPKETIIENFDSTEISKESFDYDEK